MALRGRALAAAAPESVGLHPWWSLRAWVARRSPRPWIHASEFGWLAMAAPGRAGSMPRDEQEKTHKKSRHKPTHQDEERMRWLLREGTGGYLTRAGSDGGGEPPIGQHDPELLRRPCSFKAVGVPREIHPLLSGPRRSRCSRPDSSALEPADVLAQECGQPPVHYDESQDPCLAVRW